MTVEHVDWTLLHWRAISGADDRHGHFLERQIELYGKTWGVRRNRRSDMQGAGFTCLREDIPSHGFNFSWMDTWNEWSSGKLGDHQTYHQLRSYTKNSRQGGIPRGECPRSDRTKAVSYGVTWLPSASGHEGEEIQLNMRYSLLIGPCAPSV